MISLDKLKQEAMQLAAPAFSKFEDTAVYNTEKVLRAFKDCQVSAYHLRVQRAMVMMM